MTQPTQLQPPAKKPSRLLLWIALAVLVAAGALAFVFLRGDKPATTVAAQPAAAAVSSVPATPGPDANAVAACQAASKAFNDDRLMTTDVLAVEQPARETSNAEIKAAGAALLDAYRVAMIAKTAGDDDALTKEIELTTASAKMTTACIKAGVDVG